MIDLDKILNIRPATMKPTQGRILISNPFLLDYFFRRSVVLLIDHGEDGSFGVIINKPLEFNIKDFNTAFSEAGSQVYLGGPVKSDGLFYMHTMGEVIPNSLKVMDGLWWGGSPETLEHMIKINPETVSGQVRFFLGYSGWVIDQLNEEIVNRSWVVAETGADEIMGGATSTLWTDKVRSLGKGFESWLRLPADPSFN